MEWRVESVEGGMWNLECEVWSGNWEVESVAYEVFSGKCEV